MALSEFLSVAVLLLVSAVVATESTRWYRYGKRRLPSSRPLVIAHRGASGVLPEHTVEAYRRAVSDGADVIECDVTLSRDLVPVCLHDEALSETTDVAERSEFSGRIRSITVSVHGRQVTLRDWFAFDFTVAELKTLRKRQRFDFRDQSFNGRFTIPTLAEHIAVARSASRTVAIYPELKNPALLNSIFLRNTSPRFEDIVLKVLENNGYRSGNSPCYIQCFDERSLLYLKGRTKLPLVMLIEDSVSDDRLADWSRSFYGVGVWHNALAPHYTDDNGYKNWIGNKVTNFVARAHAHGLKVHVWTLRNEDRYLAWDFQQDVHNAFKFYLSQNVDGIFTDFPQSLARYLNTRAI